MSEKKTEVELRDEIIEEYGFEADDERIDKILGIKKDRYTATQAKKKKEKEVEDYKAGKDHYKKLAGIDPKTGKPIVKEPKGNETGKEPTLSPKDAARLQEAKIAVDDWDEVLDYAKYKGIGIADAVKSTIVQASLAKKAEEKATADATNTGKGKRASTKVSGAALLQKAIDKGELPESDADMDALLEARLADKQA